MQYEYNHDWNHELVFYGNAIYINNFKIKYGSILLGYYHTGL